MPRWGMVMDTRRCIGCHSCTVSCKTENQVPLGVWRTHMRYFEKGRYPKVSRHFFPVICDHCEEAPCIEAADNNGVGSFYRSDEGVILIDYDKLKGRSAAQIDAEAQAAIESCPIEAVFVNPNTKLPEKCTFCTHRLEEGLVPACAQSCLGRTRVFGDLNDPNSPPSKLLAKNPSRTLMPDDDGGGSAVYYIGLEGSFVDYEAMEGGKQLDPKDFESGKASQSTGPTFEGWTPSTKVRRHKMK
jgi:tetrathionate reductase subunit B